MLHVLCVKHIACYHCCSRVTIETKFYLKMLDNNLAHGNAEVVKIDRPALLSIYQQMSRNGIF